MNEVPTKKGITGMLAVLFTRQPIEKDTDPISRNFRHTKQQFIAQQNDFRSVIIDVMQKFEQKKGMRNVKK